MNRKYIILVIIIGLIITSYYTGIFRLFTFDNLLENRNALTQFVSSNYSFAVIAYVTVYIAAISLSIPGAAILTLAGGYLFGVLGLPLILFSAVIGSLTNFVLARYAFGNSIQTKYASKLSKFNQEIEFNGANYLLTLRLLPVFPFFLINVLAGVSKVRIWTFVWTTFVGIIPGSTVYWYFGTQLSSINSTQNLFSFNIILSFAGLGLLSLLPVIIKKYQKYYAK